ncbi:DUF2975 domain-containing protein [Parafrankia sp. BMG5.11]|uniref:DUF2975 domain-containing protein n=1 Tax=Parafrankia sp. BMG5.11 TaxID=222540 RepID=UPI00103B9515|nr:DUF2975 domain-containing protein [Parafrankia sp. BMG5.11]TCJ41329.1 DUF2975 domain-containing protein [Parafrankia sp. BMG5.11]
MSFRPKDPLLAIAKAIVWLFTGVFAFCGALLLLVSPVVVAMQDRVLAEIAKNGVTADASIIGAILLMLLSAAAFMALLVWFLVNLRRIIESVGDGDPFIPVNADRLSRMAWIMIGVQLAALPLGAMAMYLETVMGDADSMHAQAEYGLDFGAIILVIVLFVLSRVFRQGAAMRDDLEGTV